MSTEPASGLLQDPKAQLERALRDEFLRQRGYDDASVQALAPEARIDLLRQASRHVAVKLAEVDARATYVHDIHGASSKE